MKAPGISLLDLSARIEELRDLLAKEGHEFWAAQLREDAAKLRAGDRRACVTFLSHFGGMGSLNANQAGDAATDAHFQEIAAARVVP
jgi:hypothetical protein